MAGVIDWREVVRRFDLPDDSRIAPGAGTASPKIVTESSRGRYVIRALSRETCNVDHLLYDHALRAYLAERKFPAPRVLPTPDGRTYLPLGDWVFEASYALPGAMVACPDIDQLVDAGRTLARFHALGETFRHDGKVDCVREDSPAVLVPVLDELFELASNDGDRERLDALQDELEVTADRQEGVYETLESSVIHGDFHPGNVLYTGKQVSAALDYDYAGPGAVLRDIGDAIMLLAGAEEGLDPNDIGQLARPRRPDVDRAVAVLRGYSDVRDLPVGDWQHLPLLLISRWIQIRLRGSRKVGDDEKLPFVFAGLFEQIDYLKSDGREFLMQLPRSSKGFS